MNKTLKHYHSALGLWWSRRQRDKAERSARQRELGRAQREARAEHQRALAAGEVAMAKGWYQHPGDPPGYERWWDGTRWGEQTQQSRMAAHNEAQRQSGGLVVAGWVTFAIGLFFWPAFIAPFVIGIILAARGIAGHGAALIVCSLLGPLLSLVGLAALVTSGS